jgi:hypothetical protein
MAVNSSGDKAYTIPFEGTYRSLTPYGSGTLILTSDHLYRTDAAGIKYTSGVTRDGRMVCTLGNRIIVLGLTSLDEAAVPSNKN